MIKGAIIGTPITPAEHLNELAGHSFCVSFAARDSHLGNVGDGRQLDAILRAQDPDGVLLVDNGAFSAFTQEIEIDWFNEFAPWAAAIAKACPAAIIVCPDVIDGDLEANHELMHEFMAEMSIVYGVDSERLMPVWHLHEPISRLEHMVEGGWQFVAFGSSGDYWDPKSSAWDDRIEEAFAALDELCTPENGYRRPHIHMMRAQAQHPKFDFDTSDSTNVARNHARYKGQDRHVGAFADRVREKVANTADGEKRIETPAEVYAIMIEFHEMILTWSDPDWRNAA